MTDKEVGKLWAKIQQSPERARSDEIGFWLGQCLVLIDKLVEERAELGYRRQGGRWVFGVLTDKEIQEWRDRARRDFGLPEIK